MLYIFIQLAKLRLLNFPIPLEMRTTAVSFKEALDYCVMFVISLAVSNCEFSKSHGGSHWEIQPVMLLMSDSVQPTKYSGSIKIC